MPLQVPIAVLTEHESWELLSHNSLGRLAMSVAGSIDIFPVNYVVVDGGILLRTAPGTKLFELAIAPIVALEVDGHTDHEAWSVVVKGHPRRLELQNEIDIADALPLAPWIPTLKYIYVRITVNEITGRRFVRGPEPERY
jgi:nitroimidazol reductase NimA-like FMN-containing flavoprotein (pyridoxamine 5'-phosphate oxidase superfamily)